MSLREEWGWLPLTRFPRVSGDEPRWDQIIQALDVFSPRERG